MSTQAKQPWTFEDKLGALAVGVVALAFVGDNFLEFTSWPGGVWLAGFALAWGLSRRKEALLKGLATPVLAFSLGLTPHVIFLWAYNHAVAGAAPEVTQSLPRLGPLASGYEHLVIEIYTRTKDALEGWRLLVFLVLTTAAIIALTAWRVGAGKWGAALRAGFGLAQTAVLGAVSITVFAQAPAGHWSADYNGRLQAAWADLDKARTRNLLLEKVKVAVVAATPALRAELAPAIRAGATALAPEAKPGPRTVGGSGRWRLGSGL